MVNGTAVEYAIRIGLALNCSIAETCRFARKQYFYPDLTKNFQTSQYDEPIAYEGWVDVELSNTWCCVASFSYVLLLFRIVRPTEEARRTAKTARDRPLAPLISTHDHIPNPWRASLLPARQP